MAMIFAQWPMSTHPLRGGDRNDRSAEGRLRRGGGRRRSGRVERGADAGPGAADGLVHRIAANLHQAVAKLNATGQPAGDLPAYATAITRRADHIDAVAEAVRKALR
jgi:hypothetical protein